MQHSRFSDEVVGCTTSAIKHPFFCTLGPSVDQCHVTLCTWLDLGSHPSFKIRNHELRMYTNAAILLHDKHRNPRIRKTNILIRRHLTKLSSPNVDQRDSLAKKHVNYVCVDGL